MTTKRQRIRASSKIKAGDMVYATKKGKITKRKVNMAVGIARESGAADTEIWVDLL